MGGPRSLNQACSPRRSPEGLRGLGTIYSETLETHQAGLGNCMSPFPPVLSYFKAAAELIHKISGQYSTWVTTQFPPSQKAASALSAMQHTQHPLTTALAQASALKAAQSSPPCSRLTKSPLWPTYRKSSRPLTPCDANAANSLFKVVDSQATATNGARRALETTLRRLSRKLIGDMRSFRM